MTAAQHLKNELQFGRIGDIYKATCKSLMDRVDEDGYLPESVTGAYPGEFPRTIGGYVSFLLETPISSQCEKVLRFVFESMKRNGLTKVPHIIGSLPKDGKAQDINTIDQPDARAHIVMAYARYCLQCEVGAFEDEYYTLMKKEIMDCLNQPYFFYYPDMPDFACTSLKLVLNTALEHSREYRYWCAFDLLTQSFVGASADAMHQLAVKRGDTVLAGFLAERLSLLTSGMRQHLTRTVEGKQIYLEMLLPDGNWGRPFTGMGWLCYGPIAAQWEALDHKVLKNTVDYMKTKLVIPDPAAPSSTFTALEFDENSAVSRSVIGKYMGWDIEYCRQEKKYDEILNWCEFLNRYHSKSDILMEQINFRDGSWQTSDCGNGEQCAWWCFAVAKLRKDLGLPAMMD